MAAVTEKKGSAVRVHPATHAKLRTLSEQAGQSLTQYLDYLVEQEERRLFWQRFREAAERLRADPEAWASYQAEQAEWDGTVADGVEDDEDEYWRELYQSGEALELVGDDEVGKAGTVDAATR